MKILLNRKLLLGVVIFNSLFMVSPLLAEEEDPRGTAPTEVGGLLFDFDEGVKIEQGGGGSVYVRSNREYLQNKLRAIDRRFQGLEERLEALEAKTAHLALPETESSLETDAETAAAGRRVLTT